MPMIDRSVQNKKAIAVAMTVFIAAAMLILSACDRKPVMSHSCYSNLPSIGWLRVKPIALIPEYDDSTRRYDLYLAVRHENSYQYSNLSLAVDVTASNSTANRKSIEMKLADDYGNWTGGGFGALYQAEVAIATGVAPSDVSSVVVWQTMEGCDTLRGVVNVGLFTRPI